MVTLDMNIDRNYKSVKPKSRKSKRKSKSLRIKGKIKKHKSKKKISKKTIKRQTRKTKSRRVNRKINMRGGAEKAEEEEEDVEVERCEICFFKYDTDTHTIETLPCNHKICTECLTYMESRNININMKCPFCRSTFVRSGGVLIQPLEVTTQQLVERHQMQLDAYQLMDDHEQWQLRWPIMALEYRIQELQEQLQVERAAGAGAGAGAS